MFKKACMDYNRYLDTKHSESMDYLRFVMNKLDIDSLSKVNRNTGNPPLPDPSKMHEKSIAYDDEFMIVSMMMGLAEEWFRRGMVAGQQDNRSKDLVEIFAERNLIILESLKNWFKEYR